MNPLRQVQRFSNQAVSRLETDQPIPFVVTAFRQTGRVTAGRMRLHANPDFRQLVIRMAQPKFECCADLSSVTIREQIRLDRSPAPPARTREFSELTFPPNPE